MSDPIKIPMDEGGPLVDPPVVDFLYRDDGAKEFVVTFIPDNSVSAHEKESVTIPEDSADGRMILASLRAMETIKGKAVARIFHRGDGDFGFIFADGENWNLSNECSDNATTQQLYDQLKRMGEISQNAFCQNKLKAARAG
jgi:hypothetical protein